MNRTALRKIIRETIAELLSEAEGIPTFTVKNTSQYNLFVCEILGQLSDGAWENAQPEDHWEVWHDADIKIGNADGYSNFKPKRQGYYLESIVKYVGARMLVYGAAGQSKINLAPNGQESVLASALEKFFVNTSMSAPMDLINKIKGTEYDSFVKVFLDSADANPSYMKKYLDEYTRNKNLFKTVYNSIKSGSYGTGNLKSDLNQLSMSMTKDVTLDNTKTQTQNNEIK